MNALAVFLLIVAFVLIGAGVLLYRRFHPAAPRKKPTWWPDGPPDTH